MATEASQSPCVVVLAGPTAVGKSTVVSRLRSDVEDLFFSVSMTTRDPRPGEVDGKDYVFVTREAFEKSVADGDLLEWAEIHGGLQLSGTPKAPVIAALENNHPVLIEVDLAGVRAIKKAMPQVKTVFLAPPSWEILEQRLLNRGTESAEVQNRRLETARTEMSCQGEFDTVVVNENLDEAVAALTAILRGNNPHSQ